MPDTVETNLAIVLAEAVMERAKVCNTDALGSIVNAILTLACLASGEFVCTSFDHLYKVIIAKGSVDRDTGLEVGEMWVNNGQKWHRYAATHACMRADTTARRRAGTHT